MHIGFNYTIEFLCSLVKQLRCVNDFCNFIIVTSKIPDKIIVVILAALYLLILCHFLDLIYSCKPFANFFVNILFIICRRVKRQSDSVNANSFYLLVIYVACVIISINGKYFA